MHQIKTLANDDSAMPGSPVKSTVPSPGSSPTLNSALDTSCPPVSLPIPRLDMPEAAEGAVSGVGGEDLSMSGASPHVEEPCASSAHM